MNRILSSWESNFPQVISFVKSADNISSFVFLKAHPDYHAAKYCEDRDAALRLVYHFLETSENQNKLKLLSHDYLHSIIVPIHAIEAGGKNRIPEILAEYIGKCTDLEVNYNIIQTNKVFRSGADEWYRFAFRPTFSGEVKKNHNYILVDDIFSLGGSLNELRLFIESKGGSVVQAITMATGKSGNEIALNPKTLKSLIDKYGDNTLSSFLKGVNLYEGNYNALTEPEARALRRAPSLDQARNRIFAARQERGTRMGEESTFGNKDKDSLVPEKER